MDATKGEEFLKLLQLREGKDTQVFLADGAIALVRNVAWGRDDSAVFDHVTANISPEIDGRSIEFFHTSEIVRLVDPETNQVLLE